LKKDGTIARVFYEKVMSVQNSIQVGRWPNKLAVAKMITTYQVLEQVWMNYVVKCVQPGFDYTSTQSPFTTSLPQWRQ